MSTQVFKIKINGHEMPDIYFRYDDASAERDRLKAENGLLSVSIINSTI